MVARARLATLAEEACDDSALLLVEHQPYAQALLDMAAAARTTQGRLVWEAMAMAKTAEVRKRIELILDETRQIPRAFTRGRWASLLLCGVPSGLAGLRDATGPRHRPGVAANSRRHGRVPQRPPALARPTCRRWSSICGTTRTTSRSVRSSSILHYYGSGVREPRIAHILWLVENHPEASPTIFASQGILPRDNAQNSFAEYQRVLNAWKQAVASRKGNVEVLRNAARFLQTAGEFEEAEKLLLDAGALAGGAFGPGFEQLARLYAAAILGATGDTKFPNPSPSFASRVRGDLETSENGLLTGLVGMSLRSAARRPQAGQTLPPGILNLDDHPLLVSGDRFRRAPPRARATTRRRHLHPHHHRHTRDLRRSPAACEAACMAEFPAACSAERQPSPAGSAMPPPPIVKKVDPVYPPLARQAHISGIVHLQVVIATDGTMKNMSVMSGHPLLVPAAFEAARQWTFAPPPRELTTYLDIPFMLPPARRPPGSPSMRPCP